MRHDSELGTAIQGGHAVEQFRVYKQDGRLGCGQSGNQGEPALLHLLMGAALLHEARPEGNGTRKIANLHVAALCHAIYWAIYTCEVTIGTDAMDMAPSGDLSDYEARAELSELDAEWRHAHNMECPAVNIRDEAGLDAATSIQTSNLQVQPNLEYAKWIFIRRGIGMPGPRSGN